MISRQAFKQALKLRRGHALQVLIQSWCSIWRIVSELPMGNAFTFLVRLNNLHSHGLSLFIADHDTAVLHPAAEGHSAPAPTKALR
jgi:hypothetical protein